MGIEQRFEQLARILEATPRVTRRQLGLGVLGLGLAACGERPSVAEYKQTLVIREDFPPVVKTAVEATRVAQTTQRVQQPQREPQRSEGPGPDWIKMDVPSLGISLSAPPKWAPETRNTGSTIGIAFYDKEHSSGTQSLYSAVIVITKQQRSIIMSDEDTLRQQLAALKDDKAATDIQTGTVTFGGEKAQLVSWLYLKGAGLGTPFLSLPLAERNKPVYVVGVNLAKGNVIWQATLVGDNSIRPSIESTFQKMLASLKFS